MFIKSKQIKSQEINLYNNILLLSRNKLFYTKLNLSDTFQNRIHLIFIHISFLFIKIKQDKKNESYKVFYQKMFDFIFNKIDLNIKEIGYGDVSVNKYMKLLVKTFYNILLNCEDYKLKNVNLKNLFLTQYLQLKNNNNDSNKDDLIKYFDTYSSFCFDLSSDSVLKGNFKFNYR